jgi:toxin ParE1/3/4
VRVRYTRPALADLEAILDYVATGSPQGAKRVQAKIKLAIHLLPRHPLIGTRTDDPAIRRLVVTPYPYLVFYEPTADEILIHAVRHAARNPPARSYRSSLRR